MKNSTLDLLKNVFLILIFISVAVIVTFGDRSHGFEDYRKLNSGDMIFNQCTMITTQENADHTQIMEAIDLLKSKGLFDTYVTACHHKVDVTEQVCNWTTGCGDGILQSREEQCDKGDLNGKESSSCTSDCKIKRPKTKQITPPSIDYPFEFLIPVGAPTKESDFTTYGGRLVGTETGFYNTSDIEDLN